MTPRRQLGATALALAIGCSTGSTPDSDRTKATSAAVVASEPASPGELHRRLRLAVDQLRRFLPESAAAELERVAAIDPDLPEMLLHSARLELLRGGDGAGERAMETLTRAIGIAPDNVALHRMLALLMRQHGRPGAGAHLAQLLRLYGNLAEVELELVESLSSGRQPGGLPAADTMPDDDPAAVLLRGLQLLKSWNVYQSTAAVNMIERVLRDHPDLAGCRVYYASLLLSRRIRVDTAVAGMPPMSSRRARPERRARLLLDRAVARHRQGRHGETIAIIERTLPAEIAPTDLPARWLLHLAYDAAGIPPSQRRQRFPFRPDLVREPVPELQFEDVAARLRVDKLDGLGPSAWADYDGDGDDDLYVSGCDSYGVLLRNDDGRFTDVSVAAGLYHNQSGYSATFVDYDNDGWPDLYIGRDGWNGPAANSLFRNLGDGRFADITASSGLGDTGSTFTHTWFDYDRDGLLDIYMANGIIPRAGTNRLYRNRGDGTFRDVTAAAGLEERLGIRTVGVAAGDYDDDGWTDIAVSGYEVPNRLFRNRGDGSFEESAAAAGVAAAEKPVRGYVILFVDYDSDGDLDLLRTTLAPWVMVLTGLSSLESSLPDSHRAALVAQSARLWRNDGGRFTDVTVDAGLDDPTGAMGANVADLDNDGYVDIYLGTGDPELGRLEPDRFYRNNGDGSFTDLTFATGLGNLGKGHGITFIDLDADGDLEIYAPEGGYEHGDRWHNALYMNRQRTGNHWLHLDLLGTVSNRDAIGARVTAHIGGLRITREVHGGRGFGSSDSKTVELGLGRAELIERLEVRWPSGRLTELRCVAVDRSIALVEPDSARSPAEPAARGNDTPCPTE